MASVLLALGTNLGLKERRLNAAIDAISNHPDIKWKHEKTAQFMTTEALLPVGAPPAWNQPYLNTVISGETTLLPLELLQALQHIELQLGRKQRGTWGPREIDIDILAYDDLCMDEPQLTLPHPHMLTREFVMLPLAEIKPEWCYPTEGEHQGKTAQALVAELFPYALAEEKPE